MMQQAKDFRDESEALCALVSPLADDAFNQPTAFKGWTINNVISHLHLWNWAADLALTKPDAFQDFLKDVGDHINRGTLNTFEQEWLDGLEGQALVEAWRKFYLETAERFGAADPSMRVKWAGPDMSVRSSITARLMETWAHGQEVYDHCGVVRQNADSIRNVVVLGVNTYGWTFKTRGETAPEPMPHVKLTAPSGEVWTYGDASEVELIEGAAEEFCQVVTQTRNIADTKLRVHGANATTWMSIAQCFAGPPEQPPAPGTRTVARKS